MRVRLASGQTPILETRLMGESPYACSATGRREPLAPQVALHSNDVAELLKPRSELVIEIALSQNDYEVRRRGKQAVKGKGPT
jgi:hypothetical protein